MLDGRRSAREHQLADAGKGESEGLRSLRADGDSLSEYRRAAQKTLESHRQIVVIARPNRCAGEVE